MGATYLREVTVVCNPDGSIRGAHRRRGATQEDAFSGTVSELEGPAEALSVDGGGAGSLDAVLGAVTSEALRANEGLRFSLASLQQSSQATIEDLAGRLDTALRRIAQLEQAHIEALQEMELLKAKTAPEQSEETMA